jgi:hypothetical protein
MPPAIFLSEYCLRVPPGRSIVGVDKFAIDPLRMLMGIGECFVEIARLLMFGLSYTSPKTSQFSLSHRRILSSFGIVSDFTSVWCQS